jgi:hypothetical protein
MDISVKTKNLTSAERIAGTFFMRAFTREFTIQPLRRAIALATISSLGTFNALSQESIEAPVNESVRLEEIIVTATKREENMQDLPLIKSWG